MRIVHSSDWHGEIPLEPGQKLPGADLYVFTGDMLANYSVPDKRARRDIRKYAPDWKIYPADQGARQSEAVAGFVRLGGMRRYLESPDAPVLIVRGNHDFIDLAPMFEGCNLLQEFVDNELVTLPNGMTATGHRGIPYIYGTWNDETLRGDLMERVRGMPVADIYVTHYPPRSLDNEYGLDGMGEELGSRGRPFLHCFGHIHERGRLTRVIGDSLLSNAATGFNVLDFPIVT